MQNKKTDPTNEYILIIDYAFIFLLYGVYLATNWSINTFKPSDPLKADTD
ncbi:MAG: hypothetical protein ABI621_15740 [Chloroflexota bacterium]